MLKSSIAIIAIVFAASASAETVKLDVIISAVKPEAKELTVSYSTNLGKKEITLDVSRKASIQLNNPEATLAALGPGLKASVEFDKELEIVTAIIAIGEAASPADALIAEVADSVWKDDRGFILKWDKEMQFEFGKGKNLKKYQCLLIDANRIAIVFANHNVDVIQFDESFKTFQQWGKGPAAFTTGRRVQAAK